MKSNWTVQWAVALLFVLMILSPLLMRTSGVDLDLHEVGWSTVVAGFGGAVLGAVIGGAITAFLARRERIERLKAGALRSQIKASVILTTFAGYRTIMEGSIAEAARRGLRNVDDWQIIPSSIIPFDPIAIEIDDVAFLIEANEKQLFEDYIQLGTDYTAFRTLLDKYHDLREELGDHLAVDLMNGDRFTTFLTRAQQGRLQPKFTQLNSLMAELRDRLPIYIARAQSCVTDLGPVARRYFDAPRFPILTLQADRSGPIAPPQEAGS